MQRELRVLTRMALLLCGLLLFAPPPTSAQTPCSNTNVGTITTDQQLSDLVQPAGCTIIADDLVVGTRDCSIGCTVTDFSALDAITEIRGSLTIQCCSILEISGFSSLQNISGSLVIYYNQELQRISGFGALRTVTNIEISQNMILRTVSSPGFQSLVTIQGYLLIDANVALNDLDGFQTLQMIGGDELVAGHALSILYNTDLSTLRGFRSLSAISYGTVHIEGNTNLCYAGYPQWNVGSYPPRLPRGSGDVGIDWRTRLAMTVPDWQYMWGVAGFPTLVVQNNAARTSCTSASCDPACPEGAGCLGPGDPTLCGTCSQNGNLDTCLIGSTPTDESCDTNPIPYSVVSGFFFLFIALVALVLIAVATLVGIKVYKRIKLGRKGGFDINLSSSESNDSEVGLVPMEEYKTAKPSRTSKPRTAGMIAEAVSETEIDGKKQESGGVVMSSYRMKSDSVISPQSHTSTGKIAEPVSETETDGKKRKSKPGGAVLSSYRVQTDDADASLQTRTTGTIAEVVARSETDDKKQGAKSKPGGLVLSSYRVKTEDSDASLQTHTTGTIAEAVTRNETDGKKRRAKSKLGGVSLSSYTVKMDSSDGIPQPGIIAEAVTEAETDSTKRKAKSKRDGVVLSSYKVRTDNSDSQAVIPQAAAGAILGSVETAAKTAGPAAPNRQSEQAPAKPLPYRAPKKQTKSEPVLIASYKNTDSSSGTAEQTPGPAAAATSSSARKDSGDRGRGVPKESDSLTRLRESSSDIPMKFPKEQVKQVKEFGRTDQGKVYQADAKRLIPGQKKTTVVVKQLRDGATQEEREAFLRPVEAMKALRHPNILSLMGVCSQGPTIMVLLEYCSHGNLKTYLVRKRREAASIKERGLLLRMACEMATGLMYLHSKNIAHNDFAVRNCLVSGDSSVKLGDYGLSRQTFKEDYYSRGPNQKAWPIRWMAPEQIVVQGRSILDSMPASMSGNIWSFGIALWEVCSFAQWPYEEMSNEEVIQAVKSTGKCLLENPMKSSEPLTSLYDIMQLCWQEPEQRPSSMREVCQQMQEFKEQLKRGEKPKVQARPIQPQHPTGSLKRPSSNQEVEQRQRQVSMTTPQKPAEQAKPAGQEPPARKTSGQYKPRRPAPKKPPERKKTSTSSTEPLIAQSLSQDEVPFDDRSPSLSSYSTTSLGRSPKKADAQQVILERSRSTDLAPKNESFFEQSTRDHGVVNPLFGKGRREQVGELEQRGAAGPRKDQYSFQHEADIDSCAVEMNLDAVMETGRLDNLVGEFGDGDPEDGFLLEPPEEFSQPEFSQSSVEREMERLHAPSGSVKFFVPSDNAVGYSFGPDSEDEDDEEDEIPMNIGGRKLGGAKGLTNAPPAASAEPREEYMFEDDFGVPENDDDNEGGYPRQVVSNPPPWLMDDGQFEMGFERDALEEDDFPNVVLDEEVAALIW